MGGYKLSRHVRGGMTDASPSRDGTPEPPQLVQEAEAEAESVPIADPTPPISAPAAQSGRRKKKKATRALVSVETMVEAYRQLTPEEREKQEEEARATIEQKAAEGQLVEVMVGQQTSINLANENIGVLGAGLIELHREVEILKAQKQLSSGSSQQFTDLGDVDFNRSVKHFYGTNVPGAKTDGNGVNTEVYAALSEAVESATYNSGFTPADIQRAEAGTKRAKPTGPQLEGKVLSLSTQNVKFEISCADPKFWGHFMGTKVLEKMSAKIARALEVKPDVVTAYLRREILNRES